MKLIFRHKHNGRFLTPILVLPNYVRLHHEASDRVFWFKKATLPKYLQVVHHDVRVGDVLRDIRDGALFVVQRVTTFGVVLQCGAIRRRLFSVGLVNYTRVGRNYVPKLFKRYDANQVQAKMGRAVHKIVNRFDAVTNAQRHAQEYGVGFIRVERDGSMTSIDPRSTQLKIVEVSKCCRAEFVRDPGGQAFCRECAGVI